MTREAHVQLFINNEYAGLYAIIESIDKDFLRRVFGNNATGVEKDGYLFQYKYTNPWYFECLGSGLDPYAALFSVVTHENASTFELFDPVEQMIRRAMNVPELRAAFIDGLQTAAALAGWLEDEVQLERSLISGPMRADTVKPFTNDEFETGADAMLTFARSRTSFVQCEIRKLTGPQAAGAPCAVR